jgi:hypothetical protein
MTSSRKFLEEKFQQNWKSGKQEKYRVKIKEKLIESWASVL